MNLEGLNYDNRNIDMNRKTPIINGNIKNSNTNVINPNIQNNEINKDKNININFKNGIKSIIGDGNEFRLENTYKALTLKDLFGRDVDEEIFLNLAKVIVPGKKTKTISGIIEGKNKEQNIIGNNNISNLNINTNINNQNIEVNSNKIIPGIEINSNGTNINKVFNLSITLRELFNKNINDNIYLNIKNPRIIADNNYNISGIIDGKLQTGNIDINGPNVNIQEYNLSGSIKNPNVNINGKIPDINGPKIDSNISGKIPGIGGSINGPNIKASGKIPDLDININGPSFGYDNASLTLKKLCDRDINDDINLNVINPKLWGDNYNISGIIDGKLPIENIDINGPNINLPGFDISGNVNKPNINKSGKIPNVNINKPNINRKIPEIDLNINGPNIPNNSSLTLREIFGGDVDDEINLNRYKLKVNLPNEKISGIIDSSLLPSTNFDINGPNINIPQVNLRGKKPELNVSGNIPGLNISVKKPNIDGSIPGIDINMNKPDIEFNPSKTLKEICDKDINDKIILNVINQNLWEVNNYNISGIIDGKLSTGSIDITGPNINLPQFDINGNNKTYNININTRYKENLKSNYNKNSIDTNLRGKFKSLNINDNKSSINSNYKYNPKITLRELFGRDINENVLLTSRKVDLNNNDDVFEGYIPSYLSNCRPNINFEENSEGLNGIDFSVPNINLNPYNTITNSSIKELNIDENNRRTLQAKIGESINGSRFKKSINKSKNNSRSISPNSYVIVNYGQNYKVNKFINCNITLKELCSGDVEEKITLNSPIKNKKLFTGAISIGNIKEYNSQQKQIEFNSGYNKSINILKENPFIQKSNISYNINLRNQKPFVMGDSITLKELFNGDVNDTVTITKNNINIRDTYRNENFQENEDNFDFPDLDDIKSLNEISSARNARQSSNKNNKQSNVNPYNNDNDYNLDDFDLID